jgi:hypothetical protein
MYEYVVYKLMQIIGYRYLSFDMALERGIRLDGYHGWFFYPHWKKGTYREVKDGYRFTGYGTDK